MFGTLCFDVLCVGVMLIICFYVSVFGVLCFDVLCFVLVSLWG